MRHICLVLAFLLAITSGLARAQSEDPKKPNKKVVIQSLIKKLGSNRYAIREKARLELEKIGMPALKALREASKSKDLEVSQTAGKLVKKLEQQIITSDLLTPRMVRLNLKDTPVTEAISQLAKETGFDIQVDPNDREILGKRKITLDTGKTTFWRAFDQLCRKAGLVQTTGASAPSDDRPPNIRPVPPIRIQPAVPPIKIQPGKIQKELKKRLKEALERQQQQIERLRKLQNNNPNAAKALERQLDVLKKLEKTIQQQMKKFEKLNKLQLQGAGKAIQNLPIQFQIKGIRGGGAAVPQIQKVPARKKQNNQNNLQQRRKNIQGRINGIQQRRAQIQAKKAKAQVQKAKPAAVKAKQILRRIRRPIPAQRVNPNQIVVKDGTPEEIPTVYAGAVRIQLISTKMNEKGQPSLTFRVDGEPGLQDFRVTGTPIIEKIIDNHGQMLELIMDKTAAQQPNPIVQPINGRLIVRNTNNRFYVSRQNVFTVRFEKGQKESKSLKEFNGKITTQMLAPTEPLVTVTKIMDAANKTVKGKDGGALEVVSVSKLNNGDVRLTVRMENLNQINAGRNGIRIWGGGGGVIQIRNANRIMVNGRVINQGSSSRAGMPVLMDDKDQQFQLVQVPNSSTRFVNGKITQEFTLIYRPGNGVGEASKLVLNGRRLATATIPFRFQNVDLE